MIIQSWFLTFTLNVSLDALYNNRSSSVYNKWMFSFAQIKAGLIMFSTKEEMV